jgi:hypothetical protein
VRRIAVALSVLLALTLGSAIPSAGGQPRAQKSALRLLETLTVPGLASTPVTTRTTLRKGASYRLVVTGTVTSSFTKPDGVTIGEKEDAFYCYEETNEAGVDPSNSCTRNIRYSGVLRWRNGAFNDRVENALGLKGQPAYQPSHRYELDFRAPKTGKLAFVGVRLASLSPVGSFKLELHGSAAKKKRVKKRRISGCRAARASSPRARAAGTCHWEVRYTIEQKGLPAKSAAKPATGFVESETTAAGKVFFNAKPKPGRTSTGRTAGLFVHTDTYQSPINPFLFTEGEVTVTPLTASYRRGSGEVRLRFSAVVTSITGVPYSKDEEGKNLTDVGDRAVVLAVVDFPFHRDDVLATLTSYDGRHAHQFLVAPDNELRITISPPRHLAGACRCLGTTR